LCVKKPKHMPAISRRSSETPQSPFRKFAPLAEQAKAAGKRVYHLNIGQPDIHTPVQALQAVRDNQLQVIEYSLGEGNLSYRRKLSAFYQRLSVNLTPEQIMVTTGASEALLFSMFSCFDAGDELLSPEPFYAIYHGFAHMAGIELRSITCRLEDDFRLPSIDEFARSIGPRTRGILLCNPNNPTGCLYDEPNLRALAALVRQHDLYLIVDEVYREFIFDDRPFFSALRLDDIREQVVVIDSISKRYSACGARIGALITYNSALLDAADRYAKLRLSPPTYGQLLAEAALDTPAEYFADVKAEYDRRRQYVYQRLQQLPGVQSYLPGGAFYCFARLPIDSADRFCRWLLTDFSHEGATVMLAPGEGFYATPGLGRQEVRIAYVLNERDLAAAMDCLAQALRVYPGRSTASL